MTRDEFLTVVLVERFGPDAARSRPLCPQSNPSPMGGRDLCLRCEDDGEGACRPSAATRQQLIDDLPPDSRPHTAVIVQAARP